MSTTPSLPLPNWPFTQSQNSSGTFKFPAPISNSTPKKRTAKRFNSKPTNSNASKDDDQVLPETLETYFGESKYIGGSELDSDETKRYKEQKKNEIILSNQKKIDQDKDDNTSTISNNENKQEDQRKNSSNIKNKEEANNVTSLSQQKEEEQKEIDR